MKEIAVRQLHFSYGASEVLSDVTFSLREGEILSVLGANGAGKSTLFRCVLGSLSYARGDVRVNEQSVREMTEKERAAHMAYIPQIHKPSFSFRVLDVVMMGMAKRISLLGAPSKSQEEEAYAALQKLGMEGFAERGFASLSGGEQQMVLIARAIAQDASFLIMDEPTSALDFGNQLRVLGEIRRLTHAGYGVLLSTHNPQHALSFADRMIALKEGRIVAEGAPEEVLTKELIRRLYGVDAVFAETEAGRAIVPVGGEASGKEKT